MRFGFVLAAMGLSAVSAGAEVQAPTQSPQQAARDSVRGRELAIQSLRTYYRARAPIFGGTVGPGGQRMDLVLAHLETVNRRLDSAAALAPRDSAVIAARVWHRVVSRDYATADSIAKSGCAAGIWEEWWCDAIQGFTRFHLDDFAGANQRFDSALARMNGERRCLWIDAAHVLNDFALTDMMKEVRCEQRPARNAVIWWLADPLWTVAGNERMAAHYARWTELTLADGELRLIGWKELDASRLGDATEYFIRIGHLRSHLDGFHLGCTPHGRICGSDYGGFRSYDSMIDRYMPWHAAVIGAFSTGLWDYALAPRQGGGAIGREGTAEVPAGGLYGSRLGNSSQLYLYGSYGELFVSSAGKMHTIRDAQVGMLLRGGTPRLLASYNPRHASLYEAASLHPYLREPAAAGRWGHVPEFLQKLRIVPLQTAVAVSAGPSDSIYVSTPARLFVGEMARVSLQLPRDLDSAMVSLESFSIGELEWPVSSRHRFAVFRPGRDARSPISGSDIILYAPSTNAGEPANADQVLAAMLPGSTLTSRERVGLYWEVYGLTPGDEPQFELSVAPADTAKGLATLVRALGLSSVSSSLVTFTAPRVSAAELGEDGRKAFTLQLSLSSLKAGRYILQMTTTVGSKGTTSVRRLVQIS